MTNRNFFLKVLHLLAESYLRLRQPQTAIDVADQMDDLIVCFEDPENLMNLLENGQADAGIPTLIKNWQYRQQSIYSRAYLMSLNVGQDRPKSPSNKV